MGSRTTAAVTRFYKYADIVSKDTPYAKRMARLRNRIFGEPVRPTTLRGMKIVNELSKEPLHKTDEVVNYYPRHRETHTLVMALRDYGLFRDEHEDFKEEMVRQRLLRGKPPWNPKDKAAKK